MSNFNIVNVSRVSDSRVMIIVTMAVSQWTMTRDKGNLGNLYGVDISNSAYRNHGITACNPTVNDTARAKNGVKTITLTCDDTTWQPTYDSAMAYLDSTETFVDNVIRVDFKTRKRVA